MWGHVLLMNNIKEVNKKTKTKNNHRDSAEDLEMLMQDAMHLHLDSI